MKLLVIILAIAFSSSHGFAQNGWKYLNSGVTKELFSVEFANENLGIVVGDSGTALKTIDGGQNWQQMNLPSEIKLFKTRFTSVAFVDETVVVIVGKQLMTGANYSRNVPVILRSADAGETWQEVIIEKEKELEKDTNLFINTQFIQVCMTNGINGFLAISHNSAEDGSLIYQTNNSGISWHLYKEYSEYRYGIEQLDCSKENSFIISVRTPEMQHGSESGRINAIVEIPDSNIFRKFSQSDLGNWYGSFWGQSLGANAWVLLHKDILAGPDLANIGQSLDNGVTWNTIPSKYQDICRLFFQNSYIGYAYSCSNGNSPKMILKSTDGGATWTQQKYPANLQAVLSIFAVNDTIAYAVGVNGTILKVSDDATSIEDDQTEILKAITAYPNPATGEFTIEGGSGQLTLINSLGEVVWRGFKSEEKLKIDVSAFPPGIYVLKHRAGAQMISVVR